MLKCCCSSGPPNTQGYKSCVSFDTSLFQLSANIHAIELSLCLEQIGTID